MQCLDSCFENVCELDLVFNYGQAGLILDEFVMGGLVIETSSTKIMQIYGDVQVRLLLCLQTEHCSMVAP